MKFLLSLMILFFLAGCEKPQAESKAEGKKETAAEKPKEHKNKLWTYLQSFRGKDTMPNLEDIQKQFGVAGEVLMDSETVNAKAYFKEQSVYLEFHGNYEDDYYYNFKADEGQVSLSKWIYFHEGNKDRMIQIYFEPDKNIRGWDWFENVPADKRLGPPK